MLRCAIKFTHDGTIALADDDKLLTSVEMEKIENRPRWSAIKDMNDVLKILHAEGINPKKIDRWIIDGWVYQMPINVKSGSEIISLNLNQYRETNSDDCLLEPSSGSNLLIDGNNYHFLSYRHVVGHIFSAYMTSPFSKTSEPSYILVWDGGMDPRLYYVDPVSISVKCLGPLFYLLGDTYSISTRFFGPFQKIWTSGVAEPSNVVAGRLMAYVALGKKSLQLTEHIWKVWSETFQNIPRGDLKADFQDRSDGSGQCDNAEIFFGLLKEDPYVSTFADEDILFAIHEFLGQLIIKGLHDCLERFGIKNKINLCLSGGCALNIKWNHLLRGSELVRDIYIPPFPNDSGIAIGLIGADIFKEGGAFLEWSPYLGPKLGLKMPLDKRWKSKRCEVHELAKLLYELNEPVVFLYGRSELGPRALGHRSILASPKLVTMRDHLNKIKDRESFRPVAPICLEHRANEIFTPGHRDPFMLFEHIVKDEWVSKIPAVIHLDGTARLQTISACDDTLLFELLTAFEGLSGLPVLCNTSANFNGSGFFPDVASAAEWGNCKYIWADNKIYYTE
jgi:carbamoyltransferase